MSSLLFFTSDGLHLVSPVRILLLILFFLLVSNTPNLNLPLSAPCFPEPTLFIPSNGSDFWSNVTPQRALSSPDHSYLPNIQSLCFNPLFFWVTFITTCNHMISLFVYLLSVSIEINFLRHELCLIRCCILITKAFVQFLFCFSNIKSLYWSNTYIFFLKSYIMLKSENDVCSSALFNLLTFFPAYTSIFLDNIRMWKF